MQWVIAIAASKTSKSRRVEDYTYTLTRCPLRIMQHSFAATMIPPWLVLSVQSLRQIGR